MYRDRRRSHEQTYREQTYREQTYREQTYREQTYREQTCHGNTCGEKADSAPDGGCIPVVRLLGG